MHFLALIMAYYLAHWLIWPALWLLVNLGPSIHKKRKMASKFQPSLSILKTCLTETSNGAQAPWRPFFFKKKSKTTLESFKKSGQKILL
jgi:hypothetical protein